MFQQDKQYYKQLHGSEPSTVQRTQLGVTIALLTPMDRAVNQSTVRHLYHVHLSNYCFANIWASEFITVNVCPLIQHCRQMLRTVRDLCGLDMDECGIRRRACHLRHNLLQQSNRWFTIQPTQSLYSVPERFDFKLCVLKCWPHGLSQNLLLRF